MSTTKRAALRYEVQRGVAVVTLRRHDEARNAVDGPTAASLAVHAILWVLLGSLAGWFWHWQAEPIAARPANVL